MTESALPTPTAKKARKAAAAALIGTSIEFYDYFAFSTAAALVFGKLFFPPHASPFVGTMQAFGAFAVGTLSRPLGGIVFGHLGDRVGRKTALVTTLVLMGTATFCVGLLPTYEQAGMWAPALLVLLRLIQGFAVGGEWGGAALITVEHAPQHRRTFYSSFTQLGSPGGTVLSSAMFSLATFFGGGTLLNGAWRIPFLFSVVLVIVGLIIRLRLEESPVFQHALRNQQVVKSPLLTTLRSSWLMILTAICAICVGVGGFYVTGTLFLSYATSEQGIPEQVILNAQLIAAATSVISFPLIGLLGDKFGPRRIMLSGLIATILIAAPHYLVASTHSMLWITLMLIVTQGISAGAWVAVPAMVTDAFSVQTRYTGMSLSYQLSEIVFGGLMPVAGAGLIAVGHGSPAPAILLLIGLAIINIIGAIFLGRMTIRKQSGTVPNTTNSATLQEEA